MKFYHILNLIGRFGDISYKGLDIEQFVKGSQIYTFDCKECVIATKEEGFVGNVDVTELTEDEYEEIKEIILSSYPKPQETVLEGKVEAQQHQINELTLILGDVLLGGGI